MKILLIVCGCISICSAFALPSLLDEWVSFKAVHSKSYRDSLEEHYRRGIYLSNKQMIEEHNAKYRAGLVSYELGMNHFGDQLPEEIAQLTGLNRTGLLGERKPGLKFLSPENVELPPSVDWREKGAVTPVKDQGSCGSCWAFSSTGSLEGQLFKKTGKLISLSEQNLVDCATGEYGNDGCQGGLMDHAFSYIKKNGGIDTEITYPYEGKLEKCRFVPSNSVGTINGFVDIPEGDEVALQKAVATVGPISIGINAGLHSFYFYKKGVYDDKTCRPTLNHGVLLVGYGTENGKDYWLVKNSWNTKWGEDGYVKMARNKGNQCGIASLASYPVV